MGNVYKFRGNWKIMKYVIIAGIFILIVFLGVLSFIPIGIEPLTEVYIENHTKLPINVFLNKNYNFSFTTHNLEGQEVEYNYNVIAYDVNESVLFNVGEGSFRLRDNESETVNQNYKFDKAFGRAKVEVVIGKNLIGVPWFKKKLWWSDPNYPMKIDVHFWIDEIVQTQIIIVPD